MTTDTSYPTAGARAITLTVTDAVGAHSSRTQAVYVGGQTTPPGTTNVITKLRAAFSAVPHQRLKRVRKRGLLIRFKTNTPATWKVTATMQRTTKLHANHSQRASGTLSAKTFRAHTGTGTVRLAIPRSRIAGMQAVVIRVRAYVRAPGGTIRRSLLVRIGA